MFFSIHPGSPKVDGLCLFTTSTKTYKNIIFFCREDHGWHSECTSFMNIYNFIPSNSEHIQHTFDVIRRSLIFNKESVARLPLIFTIQGPEVRRLLEKSLCEESEARPQKESEVAKSQTPGGWMCSGVQLLN